jgi:H+/gluconate symporter-like permease
MDSADNHLIIPPQPSEESILAKVSIRIQFAIMVAGATGTIILTSMTLFLTKESYAKEIELRSKFRDAQMADMKEFMKEEFGKLNKRLDDIPRR